MAQITIVAVLLEVGDPVSSDAIENGFGNGGLARPGSAGYADDNGMPCFPGHGRCEFSHRIRALVRKSISRVGRERHTGPNHNHDQRNDSQHQRDATQWPTG